MPAQQPIKISYELETEGGVIATVHQVLFPADILAQQP